ERGRLFAFLSPAFPPPPPSAPERTMSLKQRLTDDMKAAMKAGEKDRLGVIRLMNAAIKQREVDERIELDDAAVLAVLEKMVKQRRDSVAQYEAAGREDLAAVERAEIAVIEAYLPEKLGESEIQAEIDAAIAATGASGPADMGKLMGALKPKVAGRADMGKACARVRTALGRSDGRCITRAARACPVPAFPCRAGAATHRRRTRHIPPHGGGRLGGGLPRTAPPVAARPSPSRPSPPRGG